MAKEKKCEPCQKAAADEPCEEGAIQVRIRTCIKGFWFEDWAPLSSIVPPPMSKPPANEVDTGDPVG